MKLTIIREDGAVYKDGLSFDNLDLSFIPNNVHALQWDTATKTGWIEFVNESEFRKPPNESITVLPSWGYSAALAWEQAHTAFIKTVPLVGAAQPVTQGVQTL